MINKKHIIIAAVLTALTTGFTVAEANNSSNLLQMDLKRSSATDTVDVTFYTTGESQNTVATRKSANRYVVLIPNVSSASSIVPSLGGVKDLINDIQVKNVNDGIGGYTKITFETTKPVNIRTYMKKTAPLSQAQKDYKNLIAQNNKPAVQPKPQKVMQETPATKPATNIQPKTEPKAATKPVANTQPKVEKKVDAKPAVNTQPKQVQPQQKNKEIAKTKTTQPTTNVKTNSKFSLIPMNLPKVNEEKPKVQTSKKVQEKVLNEKDLNKPTMKFDKNGKRIIDLEPRVTHKIVKEKDEKLVKTNPLFEIPKEETLQQVKTEVEKVNNIIEDKTKEIPNISLPMWLMLAGGGALILLAIYLIVDATTHASKKDADRLQSFFTLSSKNQAKRRKREYQDIIDDNELNWQEKFKKYSEKEERRKPVEQTNDMSYITDMSTNKKAIVTTEDKSKINFDSDRRELRNKELSAKIEQEVETKITTTNSNHKRPKMLDFKGLPDTINQEQTHTEKLKESLQAKISQMEHAFTQTPKIEPPEENTNEVKSEDDKIISTLKDIKLKTFAKTPTLKETHRSLLEEEEKNKKQTQKHYKESRFVKLKNSPLSVNRRKFTNPISEVSNIAQSESKYLTNNNGEMEMDEKYLQSSLNEYLSILDTEETRRTMTMPMQKSSVANSLSQIRKSEAMSRSGITNPISRATNPMLRQAPQQSNYMNGLIVKSGYNIDSEKGIYLVNLDGVSALVGKINDNVFILKKFDYVLEGPLQVRLDHKNVYIVKVDGYKCLVDVAKDKMGTLIEL